MENLVCIPVLEHQALRQAHLGFLLLYFLSRLFPSLENLVPSLTHPDSSAGYRTPSIILIYCSSPNSISNSKSKRIIQKRNKCFSLSLESFLGIWRSSHSWGGQAVWLQANRKQASVQVVCCLVFIVGQWAITAVRQGGRHTPGVENAKKSYPKAASMLWRLPTTSLNWLPKGRRDCLSSLSRSHWVGQQKPSKGRFHTWTVILAEEPIHL